MIFFFFAFAPNASFLSYAIQSDEEAHGWMAHVF